jgi:hypothetical protein
VWQTVLKPVRKVIDTCKHPKELSDVYRIKIVNKTKSVIWLAKNTVGDLHDILPPDRSVEIQLPDFHKIEFFAYKASADLDITGLDYYAKREFSKEDIWVIE